MLDLDRLCAYALRFVRTFLLIAIGMGVQAWRCDRSMKRKAEQAERERKAMALLYFEQVYADGLDTYEGGAQIIQFISEGK